MSNKKATGNYGEDLAAKYIAQKGFQIIERNFRTRNGEIDIIAIDRRKKQDVLVCIEVKARSSNAYGTPLEAITHFKLKALVRTLQYYKSTHRALPELMRIDGISIQKDGKGEFVIEHHEDILVY